MRLTSLFLFFVWGVFAGPGALEMGVAQQAVPDDDKITEQISVTIRHAFVRKVLGILAIQILVCPKTHFKLIKSFLKKKRP